MCSHVRRLHLVALGLIAALAATAPPTTVAVASRTGGDDAQAGGVPQRSGARHIVSGSRPQPSAPTAAASRTAWPAGTETTRVRVPVAEPSSVVQQSRNARPANNIVPCSPVIPGRRACFTVRNPFPAAAGCELYAPPIVTLFPDGTNAAVPVDVIEYTFNGTHTLFHIVLDDGNFVRRGAELQTRVRLACPSDQLSRISPPGFFPWNVFLLEELVALADSIETLVEAVDNLSVTVSGDDGSEGFLDGDGGYIQPIPIRAGPNRTDVKESDVNATTAEAADGASVGSGTEEVLVMEPAEEVKTDASNDTATSTLGAGVDPLVTILPFPTPQIPTSVEELPLVVLANEVQNTLLPAAQEVFTDVTAINEEAEAPEMPETPQTPEIPQVVVDPTPPPFFSFSP